MADTSAEPTTAASALRATEAASSGVLMPKPTASGSFVCRLRRAIASLIAETAAPLAPVMPVIET